MANTADYIRTRRKELQSPLGFITFVQAYAYFEAIVRAGARRIDPETARILNRDRAGACLHDHLEEAVGSPGGLGVDPEAFLLAAEIALNIGCTLAPISAEQFPPSVEFGLDLRAVPGGCAGAVPVDGHLRIVLDGLPLLEWVAGSGLVWGSLHAPFRNRRGLRNWVEWESAWHVPYSTAATRHGTGEAVLLGTADAVADADERAALRAGYLCHGTLHGAIVRWLARQDARLDAEARKNLARD